MGDNQDKMDVNTSEEIKSEEIIEEEQPIVLNLDKKALKGEPRLKAEGPLFDYEGFIKNLTKDLPQIFAFIGAILVYLSPFTTWLKQTVGKVESKADLLDIAGKNGDIALAQKSIFVFGIIIILMAVCMIAFTAREYIRPLRPYADNYLLRLVPAVVTIIMYVLVVKNKAYVASCALKYIDTGLGQVFCIMGIALYSMSVIFDFMNRNE